MKITQDNAATRINKLHYFRGGSETAYLKIAGSSAIFWVIFISLLFFPFTIYAAKIGPNSVLDIANNDEDVYISKTTTWSTFAHMGGTAIGDINGDGFNALIASAAAEKGYIMGTCFLPTDKDSVTESKSLSRWMTTSANNTVPVADNITYIYGTSSISTTRIAPGTVNLRLNGALGKTLNPATDSLHFQIYAQDPNERLNKVILYAPDYNNHFYYAAPLPLNDSAWTEINMPLSSFSVGKGSPAWNDIRSCVINFSGGFSGDIKIDQIYYAYQGLAAAKTGAVFLFSCPLNGQKIANIDANTIINGIDADDLTGEYLDIKDINGDGKADLIISVARDDGPDNTRADCGAVYIIFGRSSFPESIDLKTGADCIIYGVDPGDLFGEMVYAVDVNGDDIRDLIVGAQNSAGYGNLGIYNGEVHIFYGPFNSGEIIDLNLINADISIYGAYGYDFLGFQSTIGVGDVYNDGQKDLILGVYGGDKAKGAQFANSGKILVIDDVSNYNGDIELANFSPNTTIYGADAGDQLAKITMADFNKDGIDDIIAGAANADGINNAKPDAGEIYIIFGSPALPSSIDLSIDEADIRIIGEDAGDNLGLKAYSGDVSSDGIDDLLAIAPGNDGIADAKNNCGAGYVFFGNPNRTGIIDLGSSSAELTVYGADSGDDLRDVYSGDFSGDATSDLTLGFRGADGINNGYPGAGDIIGIRGGGIGGFWLNIPANVSADLTYVYPRSPLNSDIKINSFNVIPLADSIIININTWNNSGTYYKKWQETSINNVTNNYIIGDFKPNTLYLIKVDSQIYQYANSDTIGQIEFIFSGSPALRTFEIEEVIY